MKLFQKGVSLKWFHASLSRVLDKIVDHFLFKFHDEMVVSIQYSRQADIHMMGMKRICVIAIVCV